ncbi:MAG: DUF1573 domain-containing protein [Bacteroidales bacterium]|nr:DUF1573 domain-containing protein [Bacteroidales bacterium]
MKALLMALAIMAAAHIQFDKTVHDFGTIKESDGPQTCCFTLKNTGEEPVTILTVITSCGCTNAKWTKESIPQGGSGTINVTFTNNDGPYPFDKTLTVYTTDTKKPTILHIKGNVTKK